MLTHLLSVFLCDRNHHFFENIWLGRVVSAVVEGGDCLGGTGSAPYVIGELCNNLNR